MRFPFSGRSALAVLFLGAVFGGVYFLGDRDESVAIGRGAASFQELQQRFVDLADTKGAVYAFNILKKTSLPPQTDLHLLAHAVGDELYKQKGVDGIADCTQDFRNACSHSIVIGALSEYGGEKALALIRDACKKAPGGSGAYTMCYHGLGHGVFAFYQYDLASTVELCKKTGTEEFKDWEYVECVGGAVMELMGGGGHDRDAWLAARDRYLDVHDPLAPCMSGLIPDAAKPMCLTYITPRLLELAGADLATPDPSVFPAAFSFCERIPREKKELRDSCFGGFGKDFDPLVVARDIRKLQSGLYTDEELIKITTWCELAGAEDGILACVKSALGSLFWGGENPSDISFRYCSLISSDPLRRQCFSYLAYNISIFITDAAQRRDLCAKVPSYAQDTCTVSPDRPA